MRYECSYAPIIKISMTLFWALTSIWRTEHTLFIDFILEHVDKNIRVFNLINDYNKEMFGFKAYIDDGDLMISYSDWVTDDDIIEVIDYIMDEFLGVESIEIIEEIPELMQI